MPDTRPLIYDLDLAQLQAAVTAWEEPAYRAKQIWQGLYHNLWEQPDQFTNLSNALRQRLAAEFNFQSLIPGTVLRSSDGETIKTLFTLPDRKAIEAVLMHYDERRTLCISTQAGCAMGCVFCATGQMGFMRHLSSVKLSSRSSIMPA